MFVADARRQLQPVVAAARTARAVGALRDWVRAGQGSWRPESREKEADAARVQAARAERVRKYVGGEWVTRGARARAQRGAFP